MRASFAFLLGLLAFGGPGEFRGCGGDSGDTAAPLPVEPFEGCLVDADCAARMCADVRCLAGTCEPVGDLIDRDGDGEGPLALGCGADCDDSNPSIRPGARESCNAIDDDCDGRVDESAMSENVVFSAPITGTVATIAGWEADTSRRFALFEATSGALFLRVASLDGSIQAPTEVFRLDMGGRFAQLVAVQNGRDVLLVTRTDIGAVRWVVLRPSEGGGYDVVDGPEFMELDGQALDLAVAPRAGGWLIAMDLQSFADETERLRVVYDDVRGAPLFSEVLRLMPGEPSVLDVAAVDGGFAQPLDGNVQFHTDGGLAVVAAPGPLSPRPLAALPTGEVAVAYTDAAGFLSLQRMSAMGANGPPVPGPSAVAPEQVVMRAVGSNLAIGGPADGGPAVWLRGPDMERIAGRESPLIGSGAEGLPEIAWSGDALGMLATAGGRASVVGFGIPCGI